MFVPVAMLALFCKVLCEIPTFLLIVWELQTSKLLIFNVQKIVLQPDRPKAIHKGRTGGQPRWARYYGLRVYKEGGGGVTEGVYELFRSVWPE